MLDIKKLIEAFDNRFKNSHFELRDVRNFFTGINLTDEEANEFFNGIFYKFNEEQIKTFGYENVEFKSTTKSKKRTTKSSKD